MKEVFKFSFNVSSDDEDASEAEEYAFSNSFAYMHCHASNMHNEFLFWVSSYCSSSIDNALHWGFMRVFLRLIDSSSDAHLQPWFDAMGPNLRIGDFTALFVL